jgi:hypothetical protein
VTDESENKDPPVKSIYGREVKYSLDGEDCAIAGFALSDGGYQFEFERAGRMYPLRLSKTGCSAMMALIQDILWHAPPSHTDSAPEGQPK